MIETGRQLPDSQDLHEIPRTVDPEGTDRRESTRLRDLDLRETVDPRWTIALLVAWPVLFAVGIGVMPPADDPEAIGGVFAAVFTTVLFLALAGTLIGALEHRRVTFAASTIAAGLLVFEAVACPLTGHHALGAWWPIHIGAFGALLGGSLYAWRFAPRRARGSSARDTRWLA
jgi:hypothetical protein